MSLSEELAVFLESDLPDECVPWWGGSVTPAGYGQVWYKGTMRKAHRLAYEWYYKVTPNIVCHSCDNPSCVNPKHLRNCSYKDNANEAKAKDRTMKTLTWSLVFEIRERLRFGEKQRDLALEFGVSPQTINNIKKERIWKTPTELTKEDGVTTNAEGGQQSKIITDHTLLPQWAIQTMARVMTRGAETYSIGNWRRIGSNDHISHALNHINLHQIGDRSQDHLAHAAVRLMMALEAHNLSELETDATEHKDPTNTKLEEAAKQYKDFTNQPSFEESYNQILQWSP